MPQKMNNQIVEPFHSPQKSFFNQRQKVKKDVPMKIDEINTDSKFKMLKEVQNQKQQDLNQTKNKLSNLSQQLIDLNQLNEQSVKNLQNLQRELTLLKQKFVIQNTDKNELTQQLQNSQYINQIQNLEQESVQQQVNKQKILIIQLNEKLQSQLEEINEVSYEKMYRDLKKSFIIQQQEFRL